MDEAKIEWLKINGKNVAPRTFVSAVEDTDGTPLSTIFENYKSEVDNKIENVNGKSAYEIAREQGFIGTEEEWVASLKGVKGDNGLNGADGQNGQDGKDGTTYTPEVGTVTSVEPTEDANVTIDIENDKAIFNFDIPKGEKGDKGEDGEQGRSITGMWIEKDTNNIIGEFSDGTTDILGKADFKVEGDFLTENGFGKMRFYNNAYQYYNEETDTWISIGMTADNNYFVQNPTIQPMKEFRGTYDLEENFVNIYIKEPKDTIFENQATCLVEKVIVVRKEDSYPENIEDGTKIVTVSREDFGTYTTIPFKDTTVEANKTYYYIAFVYATNGMVNSIDKFSLFCKDYYLCGFFLDGSKSAPTEMISYNIKYGDLKVDNYSFTSVKMNFSTDSFEYGSWKEILDKWLMPRPCMLKYDGIVDYYLDPNDYSKKEDGSNSDVANTSYEGNAMMEWGKNGKKIYYQWKSLDDSSDCDSGYFYICSKKLDEDFKDYNFRNFQGEEIDHFYTACFDGSLISNKMRSISGQTPMNTKNYDNEVNYAKANNVDSNVVNWYAGVYVDWMLINGLLLLIGKSTNTQEIFGQGYTSGGSSASSLARSGSRNQKGLFYGTTATNSSGIVKVFGMENYWGNIWKRISGYINNKGTQQIKLSYDTTDGSTGIGYNSIGNGYININNSTPAGTSGGYVNKVRFTDNGMISKQVSGSATTYYCDGSWFNNGQIDVALVGGSCSYGVLCGALCCNLGTPSSTTAWHFGAALSCKPKN